MKLLQMCFQERLSSSMFRSREVAVRWSFVLLWWVFETRRPRFPRCRTPEWRAGIVSWLEISLHESMIVISTRKGSKNLYLHDVYMLAIWSLICMRGVITWLTKQTWGYFPLIDNYCIVIPFSYLALGSKQTVAWKWRTENWYRGKTKQMQQIIHTLPPLPIVCCTSTTFP